MILDALAQCCTEALRTEVRVTPKPGLVDALDNGAHADMDLLLFLASAAAIAPYFRRLVETGHQSADQQPAPLDSLRRIGVECEQAMFAATRGINTHKGAIFSVGLLAAAAGRCAADHRSGHTVESICTVAAEIISPCTKDFISPENSHGSIIFRNTGIMGARGEAISGFSSVRKYALPVIRRFIGGETANRILLQALLSLMANVLDTNVIHRCGMAGLFHMRQSARACLGKGGAFTAAGFAMLGQMNRDFIERKISPGGCADLLAMAIALFNMERIFLGESRYGLAIEAYPCGAGRAMEYAQ